MWRFFNAIFPLLVGLGIGYGIVTTLQLRSSEARIAVCVKLLKTAQSQTVESACRKACAATNEYEGVVSYYKSEIDSQTFRPHCECNFADGITRETW